MKEFQKLYAQRFSRKTKEAILELLRQRKDPSDLRFWFYSPEENETEVVFGDNLKDKPTSLKIVLIKIEDAVENCFLNGMLKHG